MEEEEPLTRWTLHPPRDTDVGIRCSDSPITAALEEHTHTHKRTHSWISGCQEGEERGGGGGGEEWGTDVQTGGRK